MSKKIEDYVHLYVGCEVETVDGNGINLGHYYPEVWTENGRTEPNGINIFFKSAGALKDKVYVMNYGQCKLKLRPLSDMTEEEFKEILPKLSADIFGVYHSYIGWKDRPKHVIILENRLNTNTLTFKDGMILLSKHFDLFGLIEKGFAIDKTKMEATLK